MADSDWIAGWDVGGAHLKAALLHGGALRHVTQLPCALWMGMDRLQAAWDAVAAELPAEPVRHAVTMTGEMADLFADRASGVAAIVGFFRRTLASQRPADMLSFFAGEEGFADADEATRRPDAIASANWIATAAVCAASWRDGLLVDVGSTTTDLIPFAAGRVAAAGTTDAGRMASGELAYVGIVRTPLMALAARAPVAGHWRATMNEYFATTADVFRVLGELDEAADQPPAADNGAKDGDGSARRLLRMVGEDRAEAQAVRALARWYRSRLLDRVEKALSQVVSRSVIGESAPLIGAGAGRFLVPELATRLARPWQDIATILCPEVADPVLRARAADCAPAVAVARLAAGQAP
jgi:(4-(4-[2-(gamma-L-glutamylamino)ethyl]phenoxymethyl)furan-2-yl)methanamine synthase